MSASGQASPGGGHSVVVLLVASGAAWEPAALRHLDDGSGVVVLKRCVDVDDVLASAASGQADVAVLGLDAPGLDASAVELLGRHGVSAVAVVPTGVAPDAARLRASRVGIATVVPETRLESLADAVRAAHDPPSADPTRARAEPTAQADAGPTAEPGRVVVVWGPAGAPGRTTVAAGLAAELARRHRRTVLVDADPWGGTVAQQLGVLDEVSGLLAAARLATSGALEERAATVQRSLDAWLSVVTGLPRADRWVEVRPGVLELLVSAVARGADVVVDTGFSLEDDPAAELSARPARNHLTLAALDLADEVVVVGTADPVGLSRLARGLVELREVVPVAPVRVVVNRMRTSLGWSERDVAGMVAGFAETVGLHFLPDDRAAVDRALVAGRTLAESGDAPLPRALAGVVDALAPGTGSGARRPARDRRTRRG